MDPVDPALELAVTQPIDISSVRGRSTPAVDVEEQAEKQ